MGHVGQVNRRNVQVDMDQLTRFSMSKIILKDLMEAEK